MHCQELLTGKQQANGTNSPHLPSWIIHKPDKGFLRSYFAQGKMAAVPVSATYVRWLKKAIDPLKIELKKKDNQKEHQMGSFTFIHKISASCPGQAVRFHIEKVDPRSTSPNKSWRHKTGFCSIYGWRTLPDVRTIFFTKLRLLCSLELFFILQTKNISR